MTTAEEIRIIIAEGVAESGIKKMGRKCVIVFTWLSILTAVNLFLLSSQIYQGGDSCGIQHPTSILGETVGK